MTRRLPLSQWKPKVQTCDCDECKSMCQVPCFPSPEEAKKLIKLGYGDKLMLNSRWWHPPGSEGREVFLLCPAHKGAEGATDWSSSRRGCTLQKRGKCTIHDVCKPIEGRLAICQGREPVDLRDRVLKLWDNIPAQKLVIAWAKKFGKNKENLLMHLEDAKVK